jgi:hypothetical protein
MCVQVLNKKDMQNYQILIYDMIEGITPKEKHDNIRGLLNACEAICYPRRGTPEWDMSIEEAANSLFKYIKNPDLKERVPSSEDSK